MTKLKEWPEIEKKIDKSRLKIEYYVKFKCNRGFDIQCETCLQKTMILSIEAHTKGCKIIKVGKGFCGICSSEFACEGPFHLQRHVSKHSIQVMNNIISEV